MLTVTKTDDSVILEMPHEKRLVVPKAMFGKVVSMVSKAYNSKRYSGTLICNDGKWTISESQELG